MVVFPNLQLIYSYDDKIHKIEVNYAGSITANSVSC